MAAVAEALELRLVDRTPYGHSGSPQGGSLDPFPPASHRIEVAVNETEFSAHVTTDAVVPAENEDAFWDFLIEEYAAAPFHAAFGAPGGRLDIQMTVFADNLPAAARCAAETAEKMLAVSEVFGDVVAVEVLTAAELDRRLFGPPDTENMMTTRDVAARLKVSRQRVLQLAQNLPSFPSPVQIGKGLAWSRSAVERFAENWVRKPGPKTRTGRSVDPGDDV